MFIDTHCHLTNRYIPLCQGSGGQAKNADEVIARAAASGVGALICACAEPGDFESAIALAEKHKNVFATIGIHPDTAGKATPDYGYLLSHPKVVGVGEIGLDYHYNAENKNQQIELFRAQLEIARCANLPIAVHSRDVEEDIAAALDGSVGGVMHCFTGSWDFAAKMLDQGFYFSASGIITFKNSNELREVFAKIPLDRIVIETDAPWCAPVPFRGKPCEPAMVAQTARVLAETRGLNLPELEIILEENTKRLYPKLK
ncbi:MAG: TatD family hydrolase [Alphaproteobacteria bacterium]|nr:TatD family hydrolase [Alphaproteobacteria bacterium]